VFTNTYYKEMSNFLDMLNYKKSDISTVQCVLRQSHPVVMNVLGDMPKHWSAPRNEVNDTIFHGGKFSLSFPTFSYFCNLKNFQVSEASLMNSVTYTSIH